MAYRKKTYRRRSKPSMFKVAHKNMLKGALVLGVATAFGFTQGQQLINSAVSSVRGMMGGQS